VNGIVDMMTPSQVEEYAAFSRAYERVRESEGWGGDDLDLPFRARRNRYVWNVRKRTFRRFSAIVRDEFRRGGTALDAGAGNCWLSGHLVRWGFAVTALDVNSGNRDGLGAASYYLDQGIEFDRVRAPVESLPFTDQSCDLIVMAGAFHYVADDARVLGECRRVLKTRGRVIIFDSPWYERSADGDRAVRQRVQEHTRTYGISQCVAWRSSYLLRDHFEKVVREAGLVARVFPVWPGPRRSWEALRARLRRSERIAEFPVILLMSNADATIG
jgi:SAM-dependent methyltransferase